MLATDLLNPYYVEVCLLYTISCNVLEQITWKFSPYYKLKSSEIVNRIDAIIYQMLFIPLLHVKLYLRWYLSEHIFLTMAFAFGRTHRILGHNIFSRQKEHFLGPKLKRRYNPQWYPWIKHFGFLVRFDYL